MLNYTLRIKFHKHHEITIPDQLIQHYNYELDKIDLISLVFR